MAARGTLMTAGSLTPAQHRVQEIIIRLGFGIVRGLAIRDGQPCFGRQPRIVQSVKLGSNPEPTRHAGDNDTLKKAFSDLFQHLGKLRDCMVDIEVQRGLPFKLIVERSCEEFE
jgi:hypothetical protein